VAELMATQTAAGREGGLICLLCGKGAKLAQSMRTHLRDRHVNFGKYQYKCPACGNLYCSIQSIKVHMSRNHGGPRGLDYTQYQVPYNDEQ
jgi:hypothetical protein